MTREIVTRLASVIQYLHSRFICVRSAPSCFGTSSLSTAVANSPATRYQHRDLKLENILVESQELGGCVKLCEYGSVLHAEFRGAPSDSIACMLQLRCEHALPHGHAHAQSARLGRVHGGASHSDAYSLM